MVAPRAGLGAEQSLVGKGHRESGRIVRKMEVGSHACHLHQAAMCSFLSSGCLYTAPGAHDLHMMGKIPQSRDLLSFLPYFLSFSFILFFLPSFCPSLHSSFLGATLNSV